MWSLLIRSEGDEDRRHSLFQTGVSYEVSSRGRKLAIEPRRHCSWLLHEATQMWLLSINKRESNKIYGFEMKAQQQQQARWVGFCESSSVKRELTEMSRFYVAVMMFVAGEMIRGGRARRKSVENMCT